MQGEVRIASSSLGLLLSEGGVAESSCSFLGATLPALSDDGISDIRCVVSLWAAVVWWYDREWDLSI